MAAVPNSILDTTKKALDIFPEDDTFDVHIIMHINSVFATLAQLGVGPDDGFEIEDSEQLWVDFLGGNKLINSVKSLMYLQVRVWFDPPTTSFDLSAKQDQIKELHWRLNVAADKPLMSMNGSAYSAGAFMWTLEGENVWPHDAEEGDLGIYPATGNVWRKS